VTKPLPVAVFASQRRGPHNAVGYYFDTARDYIESDDSRLGLKGHSQRWPLSEFVAYQALSATVIRRFTVVYNFHMRFAVRRVIRVDGKRGTMTYETIIGTGACRRVSSMTAQCRSTQCPLPIGTVRVQTVFLAGLSASRRVRIAVVRYAFHTTNHDSLRLVCLVLSQTRVVILRARGLL
jgi:hypothetical protein